VIKAVEWVWIMVYYAYYIATIYTSTVDGHIDHGNL